MKKILLAALLAGVATSALAADLPTRKAAPAPAPVYAPPMFTWTGFYLGLNGGYGWGSTSSKSFGDPTGGFIGGTAGYNYQMGQLVIGVEGDWDWAHLTHTQATLLSNNTMKVDSILTARARLGYAMDRTLLFITGGYAGADTKGSYFDPVLGFSGSSSKWRNGGAIGAGLEYAFTNNITAKAEYLFLPFGGRSYFSGTPYRVHSNLNVSELRVGLNYKF
jgi:outer membrane immunogenic protein